MNDTNTTTKPGVLAVMEAGAFNLNTLAQREAMRAARATVELLDALLDEATGYVEAISNGTAKHIDPAAAEALAARMNAALAAFRGEA